jgi:hypothetical protein
MVARVKDLGLLELRTFKSRVLRVAGLGRISKGDADNLINMINQIEAYVIRMPETPDKESRLW